MRTLALAAISLLALAGSATARDRVSGEQKLAKLLEGRVAEAPVSCIRDDRHNSMEAIDRTALVFGRGNVIYVNRTLHPRSIDDDDALVVRKYGVASQLCRSDIITTMDRGSQMYTGNVFLGDFVPYRRAR
jgi:hypothetical protein